MGADVVAIEEVGKLLTHVGTPIGMLSVFVVSAIISLRWLANKAEWFTADVIKPLLTAHLGFLSSVQTQLESQTTTMETLSQTQQQAVQIQEATIAELKTIRNQLEEQNALLKQARPCQKRDPGP